MSTTVRVSRTWLCMSSDIRWDSAIRRCKARSCSPGITDTEATVTCQKTTASPFNQSTAHATAWSSGDRQIRVVISPHDRRLQQRKEQRPQDAQSRDVTIRSEGRMSPAEDETASTRIIRPDIRNGRGTTHQKRPRLCRPLCILRRGSISITIITTRSPKHAIRHTMRLQSSGVKYLFSRGGICGASAIVVSTTGGRMRLQKYGASCPPPWLMLIRCTRTSGDKLFSLLVRHRRAILIEANFDKWILCDFYCPLIGKEFYVFHSQHLLPDYPKPLTELGLPSTLEKLDAALVWGHNNRTYFYSGMTSSDSDVKWFRLKNVHHVVQWILIGRFGHRLTSLAG